MDRSNGESNGQDHIEHEAESGFMQQLVEG